MPNSSSSLLGVAYGTATALIWAGFPVLTQLSLEQTLSPLDVAALRFGIAGLLLLPVVWRHGLGRLSWTAALLLTAGAGAPYVLITASGLLHAPAAHFGVITPSCMLLFSTLGSSLLLDDRPSLRRLAGLAVIVGGLMLLAWDGLANFGGTIWQGDLMFAGGGLLWAVYTVGSRYFGVRPIHAAALVAVLSAVAFAPVYLALRGLELLSAPLREIALQGVFQGVLSAIVALVLFTRAVALLGASRGAVFGALVPALALLLAIPVLGDRPTALQIAGVIAVSCGMLLALGALGGLRMAGAPLPSGAVGLDRRSRQH